MMLFLQIKCRSRNTIQFIEHLKILIFTFSSTVFSKSINIFSYIVTDPFDYYIFNFALHLVSNNQQTSSWENWSSAYFALACDYLVHFLPTDPNTSVLPHIPNYTGKVPMAAPLQTANR